MFMLPDFSIERVKLVKRMVSLVGICLNLFGSKLYRLFSGTLLFLYAVKIALRLLCL